MTIKINEVINKYEQVEQLKDASFTYIALFFWIAISLSLLYFLVKNRKAIRFSSGLFYMILLLGSLSINSYLYNRIVEYDFSLTEETWKKDYFIPYLDTRTDIQTPVEIISLTPDTTKQRAQSISHDTKNLSYVLIRPLETNEEILIQVKIKNSSTNKPYLSYKKIEKNISSDYIEKAYYEPVLYIPSK